MNNEPAFPIPDTYHPNGQVQFGSNGITIRDYFAAKILPIVYSDYCKDADVQGYVEDWRVGVAKDAYAMANAMLMERDKQNV